jgi:hypothetical protein
MCRLDFTKHTSAVLGTGQGMAYAFIVTLPGNDDPKATRSLPCLIAERVVTLLVQPYAYPRVFRCVIRVVAAAHVGYSGPCSHPKGSQVAASIM